jgi:hypothetical protein
VCVCDRMDAAAAPVAVDNVFFSPSVPHPVLALPHLLCAPPPLPAHTHNVVQGLEELVQSQGALGCLLEGGDYPGALDLLEQMRGLVEGPGLAGLQVGGVS